jgi:polar amino acid transport system permease protein
MNSWWVIGAEDRHPGRLQSWFWLSLTVMLLAGLCVAVLMTGGREWQWQTVGEYRKVFLAGWGMTVGISVLCLLGSLLTGALLAAGQLSRLIPIRSIATVIVEFIRGTPLLVQIMFFFYVVADGIGLENRYLVGILTLSLYSGTYIAEIFRGGFETSGRSQLMAARAVGMTDRQAFRYILFPQTIRAILPALAGQLVALIKHSSLLSVIAVNEFTYAARSVNAITYSTLESYLPLLIGYIILTLPVSLLASVLERRFHYET